MIRNGNRPLESEAEVVANHYLTPDLDAHVRAGLATEGLSYEGLNALSTMDPAFVREQNTIFHARMARLRPHVYGILGRVRREPREARRDAVIGPQVSEESVVAQQISR